MFDVSDALKEAIECQSPEKAKSAILGYLHSDSRNRTKDTEKAVHYALDHGIDLFEMHDTSIEMENDQSKWNDKYIAQISTDLFWNFSQERFDHWVKVAEYVRTKMEQTAPPSTSKYTEATEANTPKGTAKNVSGSHSVDPALAVGLIAAAVVVGAILVIGLGGVD